MSSRYEIDKAREALTLWTIRKAARVAKDIGFSYEPSEQAPQTFEEVKAEYSKAQRSNGPFRVWNGACENTIYTCAEGNYAFRFVHDLLHAVFGYQFTLEDELKVAQWHQKWVAQEFGADSIEFRLITIDTAGQSLFEAQTGAFPEDQLAFALERLV